MKGCIKPFTNSMKLVLICTSIIFFASFQKPPVRIIFFGDSITQAAVGKDGYITMLDSIKKEKNRNYQLVGEGISGNRIRDLLTRVEKDVLSKEPAVVLIRIGVNDVWHGKFKTDSDISMFSHDYSELLREFKAQQLPPCINCMYPSIADQQVRYSPYHRGSVNTVKNFCVQAKCRLQEAITTA